mgnify:CR=1 FL=1
MDPSRNDHERCPLCLTLSQSGCCVHSKTGTMAEPKWLRCDDEEIFPVRAKEVAQSKHAYLLLYRRRFMRASTALQ